MEHTYLQWNIVNWVTVMVMAAIGVTVVGAVASAISQQGGNNEGE
jgi:hypothetical protein